MVLEQKPFSVQDSKCLEINENSNAVEETEDKLFQCMYSSNCTLLDTDPQVAVSVLLAPNQTTVCDSWQIAVQSGGTCDSTGMIYNGAAAMPGAIINSTDTNIPGFWNGSFAITKTPNDDFPLKVTDRYISIVPTNDEAMPCSSILPVFTTDTDGNTLIESLTFVTCAGGSVSTAAPQSVNVEFAIIGNKRDFSVNQSA